MSGFFREYILNVLVPTLKLGRHGELEEWLGGHVCISRQHAEIIVQRDDITNNRSILIQDLGSKNGTFVNGEELEKKEWRQLADGDRICLGSSIDITHCIEYTFHLSSEVEDHYRYVKEKEFWKISNVGGMGQGGQSSPSYSIL